MPFRTGLILILAAVLSQPASRAQQAENSMPEKAAVSEAVSLETPPVRQTDESQTPTVEYERLGEIVKMGGEVVIREGQEARDPVVIFGDITVEGRVRGDLVVVAGKARVNGTVTGSLVGPMSRIELGPNAHIRRELIVVGGSLDADPGAQIEGDKVEITWQALHEHAPFLGRFLAGTERWIMQGLILARPLPHQTGWWWW